MLLETPGKYPDYKNKQGETLHGIHFLTSKNYPSFMKLPIEGRMPQAANEIVVSRSLIRELEKDGEKNPTSVQLGDRTFRLPAYMSNYRSNRYIPKIKWLKPINLNITVSPSSPFLRNRTIGSLTSNA
ncbi:hypothetical protein NXW71_09405 [Parabacteroides merdae]|nr:hypothetical protein [Parabacteroides merdae]